MNGETARWRNGEMADDAMAAERDCAMVRLCDRVIVGRLGRGGMGEGAMTELVGDGIARGRAAELVGGHVRFARCRL